MAFSRVIFTLLLAAWLPLSCCCRLHALQDAFADVVGVFAASHAACTHCHDSDRTPDHSGHACSCDSHDQAFVRGSQSDLPSDLTQFAATLPEPVAPVALLARWRPMDATPVAVEARLKAGSTLLRLHCALTI